MGAAQDADDRPGAGGVAGLEVAAGVAHHGHRVRVVHPEAGHGAEDEVGRRTAPAHVGRRQGQVDLGAPAQGVEQRVAGGGCEARGEADLHPGSPEVAQHREGARASR